MRNKNPYILGLDVGTNSIGWAVVDCAKEEGKHQGVYAGYKPLRLRALNSRIFEDMLEAKTKVPKNQKRRAARGARNRRAYYKQRRKNLVKILTEKGLLPDNYQQDPERILNEIDRNYAERKLGKTWSRTWTSPDKAYCSPYAMRNFALEEELQPYEFGRLLLHLQRRRGYFSNRGAKYIELIKYLSVQTPQDDEKAMSVEEKKETGPVLKAIGELANRLDGRTLGQFIWQKSQDKKMPPQRITLFEFEKSKERKGETIIDRLQFRAQREMHENEFDAILKKQNAFHSLDDETIKKIREAIFHQRPLQLQKGTVGNCNVYPRKKRVALMRLEVQEFRTWQMINNIKIGEQLLNAKQRRQLFELANNPDKLNESGRIGWPDVAKYLGVKRKDINYNRGDDSGEGKTGLIGNKTARAISASIGKHKWQALGTERQIALVEDLLSIHNKKALYNRLVNYWKFASYRHGADPEKAALGLAMNEQLEDGYGKHSLRAINALLPHLREGKDYYAAMEAIGARESITRTIRETAEGYHLHVEDVPNIANPTVQKALYEMRRVINAIVKRYGKPAIIRMEMARDMKSSKKHRREIESQQKANRKRNEEAEKEILQYHKKGNLYHKDCLKEVRDKVRRVNPDARNKYKMWKYEQEERCPYCQEPIGFNKLFSYETEKEHILPYTGFRQSHMNTVVSCQTCNQTKGQQTPYQAWGHDTARWARIEKFAKSKYVRELYPKQRNILKKEHSPENEDEFVKRQLNDTRYIATASKKMLKKYGVPIDVNNGAATSEMRRRWGLNVLPPAPDAGVYTKEGDRIDTETGEILRYDAGKAGKAKNRGDHRHHAIDAFVVAMTDRAMLKAMIDAHKQEQDNKDPSRQKTEEDQIKERRFRLPPSSSWQDGGLHALLKDRLNATVVSHMTKRKVWGALHEETRYGKSQFEQRLKIDNTRTSTLKRVRKIAAADKNDDTDWITDEELRATLLQWATEALKLKPAARSLPQWQGAELTKFAYHTPCMTCRKELADLTNRLLSKLGKDWQPGTGTWIAEKSVHDALFNWLEDHGLVGKDTKKIKQALYETPPRIRNKKGKFSTIIRRVRIAMPMTDAYIKIENGYVTLGSNHHFVLFHNGKEGNKRERRCIMVTMLEAAQRASAGKPVIVTEPPSEWEEEWHYELDLCVNDMVKCKDMNIFEDTEKFAPEHRNTPYFRVQKMSGDNCKKINLSLRHHSVSGTDSNWGLWHIQSLAKVNCKKVQFGNLGLLLNDP